MYDTNRVGVDCTFKGFPTKTDSAGTPILELKFTIEGSQPFRAVPWERLAALLEAGKVHLEISDAQLRMDLQAQRATDGIEARRPEGDLPGQAKLSFDAPTPPPEEAPQVEAPAAGPFGLLPYQGGPNADGDAGIEGACLGPQ